MIKLVFCARRRADVSREFFHDYWRNHHGPLFQRYARQYRALRYVQNHTLDTGLNEVLRAARGTVEPYDGVGEIWWASEAEFLAVAKDPDMADIRKLFVADEARFVDLERSAVFFTQELEFPLDAAPLAGWAEPPHRDASGGSSDSVTAR